MFAKIKTTRIPKIIYNAFLQIYPETLEETKEN